LFLVKQKINKNKHTVTPLVFLESLAEKCTFSCLFNAKFIQYLTPKEGEQGTSNDDCSMTLSGSKAKLLIVSNGVTIAIVSKIYHEKFKTRKTAFLVQGVMANLESSKGVFVRLDRTANT
jgi:sulfur transfer complex TusBCD TusB component (DsrH family)